jgi:hydrogenase large subunit
MQTISVDPVTRIEGHLKIEVEVDGGKVVSVQSSGTLFRGIELILQGHDPRDAQELVQRICGVCPVGHATASAFALDDAFGIEPPDNGRILRNLILGANYIQSDILHFYHLAAKILQQLSNIFYFIKSGPRLVPRRTAPALTKAMA